MLLSLDSPGCSFLGCSCLDSQWHNPTQLCKTDGYTFLTLRSWVRVPAQMQYVCWTYVYRLVLRCVKWLSWPMMWLRIASEKYIYISWDVAWIWVDWFTQFKPVLCMHNEFVYIGRGLFCITIAHLSSSILTSPICLCCLSSICLCVFLFLITFTFACYCFLLLSLVFFYCRVHCA